MRFGRVLLYVFAACLLPFLILDAPSVAQVDGLPLPAVAPTATVPRLIRITGSVHDQAANAVNATRGITFTLYNDQNGQGVVWQETQNLRLDSSGRFSALLGATNEAGLPQEIFSAGEARWLGIRPDGQAEQPRILLLSVAYALKAADAETLGGKPASAFVLADSASQYQSAQSVSGALAGAESSQRGPQVLNQSASALPLLVSPQTACSSITSDGTATANQLAKFTGACVIENSAIFESGGNVGIGNTSPAGMLDVTGTSFFRSSLNVMGGIVMAPVQPATKTAGFASNPVDIEASTYNSSPAGPQTYLFRWQASPVGNNTANPSAALNLLFGIPADIISTGFSVASNGILTFAPGQTFPGASGGVTNVATGAGLTGGPITSTGTISIPAAGVTNAMLANPSVTVTAGSGLSGGGTVALGGTISLASTATGTVTNVATGAGLTGGPITKTGTISIPAAGVTNAMLANPSVTVTAGSGLSGGGTVALGGTISLASTATGTVTNVATGAGLTGGPITKTGTISIPAAGVTNTMLANPSVTVTAGSGLSGGGTVALGGKITLTNTAPSLGGTVTSVASGTGLSGGPITGSGTLSLNTTFTDARYLQLIGGALTGGLSGTTAAFTGGLSASTGTFSGSVSEAGAVLPKTGTATATKGFNSNTLDLQASAFSSTSSSAVAQDFRWMAEPAGNNTANASSSLNLLFGSNGSTPAETGFSIASNGLLTFASGQTFPGVGGSGTVTSVATGAGLTGGPITSSGTISIPAAGVTNAMLANSSVKVVAGSGLSGGGSVALGGSVTLTSTATGTVTNVATGAGLTGGPITASGTISIPSAGVTNTMLANPSINVVAGTGLTGGGTVALGGTVTLSSTASGGTVTNVATGAGLTGGPITGTGTISIPAAGVTNTMLANPSVKVVAGSGLSGGGTVALGGTITLTNASPSLGGTVTSVGSGTGLTGGPITGSGSLSLDTSFTDARYLQLVGGALTGGLTGTTASFSGGLTASSGTFSSGVSEAGAVLPTTGTATATQGFNSNALDLQASSFNSTSSTPVAEDFRWMAEPTASNTANPSGSLNLLFGSNGAAPAETGFSIASNGLLTFAPGQTFPGLAGGGTVTSVATGAGLTGGPITGSGTISIPAAGVTNAMLQKSSVTVKAGTGLSGGGTVALGGTITLTNTASGGTVTSVASGTGLTGGPITGSGTLSLDTSFTDGRYLQLSGGVLSGALTGTTAAFTGSLGASTGTFSGPVTSGPITASGLVSAAGALLPQTNAATSTQGFNSNTLDLQASSFNSTSSAPVVQDFQWMAEAAANNTANPSGSLNLLFGANGNAPAETGLSIASNGLITFASGQTFPGGGGGGGGTVTSVNTGAGLTGGPITSSGTISIPVAGVTNGMLANPSINVVAGSGLSGGGTVALGGTVTLASNFSGTSNGIAYFSSPTNLISTSALANGQVLIGSTGNAPVLSTLTAGQNVTITNSPGSITISAAGGGGGSPTLPFFATGGQRTGTNLSAVLNVTKVWGFLLPYSVTTSKVTYDIMTPDNTAHDYDIGIFDNSGNLLVDLGAAPGTAFASAKGFHTLSWTQGPTNLPPGRYYIGFTTNCSATCAAIAASTTFVSYAISLSAGPSTGGALPATLTPPADLWNTGNQPMLVIQ